ncbi:hypothetical protein MMC10_010316 [Thelotrema lepadinum]|nr:hypothetical protein [Thelotrema lepadinum]
MPTAERKVKDERRWPVLTSQRNSFSVESFNAAVDEDEALGAATLDYIGCWLIAADAPFESWLSTWSDCFGQLRRNSPEARKFRQKLALFTKSDAFRNAKPYDDPPGRAGTRLVEHYILNDEEAIWNWLQLHSSGKSKEKSKHSRNPEDDPVNNQSQRADASRSMSDTSDISSASDTCDDDDESMVLAPGVESSADGKNEEDSGDERAFTKFIRGAPREADIGESPASMGQVHAFVESHRTSSSLQRVPILMKWDIHRFAREELEPDQQLENLFIVTGDPENAWAGRCRDYMQSVWPRTAHTMLEAVQQYIFYDESKPLVSTFVDGAEFKIQVTRSLARFDIEGTRKDIVEAIQQLAWLASSLRPAADDDFYISYTYSPARFSLSTLEKINPIAQSNLIAADNRRDSTKSCWESLVEGPCVSGFPLTFRPKEYVGLEIDFDTLLKLACIQYPVHHRNTIAFRGWHTLLYPVSASSNFDCIQWHIVCSDTPDDPRLTDELAKLGDINGWKSNDVNVIRNARSFLGYARRVDVGLGTQSYSLQDASEKSGAKVEEAGGVFWQKKVTFSLGPSFAGFGNAAIGGELGFRKPQVAKMAAFNNFKRVLQRSAQTPVLMYDVKRCTAWLVPELSVVLHMTRSWFTELGDPADDDITKLPAAELKEDGGKAALRSIEKNEHLRLKQKHNSSSWDFMSIIKDSVNILHACRQTRDPAESIYAQSWIGSKFHNPRLYGWDLADLLVAHASTLRKETTLDINPKDKWISHIANHPSMLVLFCKNIDQPITLANPSEICRYWDPIPPGRNYLIATARCLLDLSTYCNGDTEQGKLTNGCWLTRPDGTRNPFSRCKFDSHSRCKRLHQVVTTTPSKLYSLPEQGAVILGTPGLNKDRICLRKKAAKEPKQEKFDDTKGIAATTSDSDSDSFSNQSKSNSIHSSSRTSPPPTTDSPSRRDPLSPDFEMDCQLLIAALAERRNVDVSVEDIDQLIEEGREQLGREKRLKQALISLRELNNAIATEIINCNVDLKFDYGDKLYVTEANKEAHADAAEGVEDDLYD